MDRADIIHESFLRRVKEGDFPPGQASATLANAGLSAADFVGIFRSQVLSRQLDRTSRKLQARGEGYYTIGSSGHEGNAAIAAAFRPTDMAVGSYEKLNRACGWKPQIPLEKTLEEVLNYFRQPVAE